MYLGKSPCPARPAAKGIRRAEENFSFSQPLQNIRNGEYRVLVFRTALLHFQLMIHHLYIVKFGNVGNLGLDFFFF